MGKDERAISVSAYVHQGRVKYTDHAFNKTFGVRQIPFGQKTEPVKKAVNCAASVAGPERTR
jgi:hypothetical protein